MKNNKLSYWKKNQIPLKSGWYWMKYKGKTGMVICPASVDWLDYKGHFFVRTARNDSLTTNSLHTWGDFWFGAEIEMPNST